MKMTVEEVRKIADGPLAPIVAYCLRDALDEIDRLQLVQEENEVLTQVNAWQGQEIKRLRAALMQDQAGEKKGSDVVEISDSADYDEIVVHECVECGSFTATNRAYMMDESQMIEIPVDVWYCDSCVNNLTEI